MTEMSEIVEDQMTDTLRKGREDGREAVLITLGVQDHFPGPDHDPGSDLRCVGALEADLIVLEGNFIFLI